MCVYNLSSERGERSNKIREKKAKSKNVLSCAYFRMYLSSCVKCLRVECNLKIPSV